MEGDAGTGPAIDWVPRTPGHCPVCGTIVPKVEDPSYGVRAWARHLNYQKHLKETHPAFYAWNHRWDTIKIPAFVPALVLALVAAWQKDAWLLLLAGVLLLVVLALLLNYRRTWVRRFRESWRGEQDLPATT